ncbi:MAG: hypothetical protein J6331_00195 [Lentisphaeria bacterium]|nr:hypothetical protein [Lentisphaeria bacterium]
MEKLIFQGVQFQKSPERNFPKSISGKEGQKSAFLSPDGLEKKFFGCIFPGRKKRKEFYHVSLCP